MASVACWRLVYAFIEKEECSKEEKTCGQNREVAQISYFVSMLFLSFISYAVTEVNLFRRRKIATAGSKKKMLMTTPAGLDPCHEWGCLAQDPSFFFQRMVQSIEI
jgi:hypothetical protein